MSKKDSDVFSVEKLRELLDLMHEYELTELDLKQEQQEIRFSRAGQAPQYMVPAPSQALAAYPASSNSIASSTGESNADGPHIKTITSPMVGTFYSRPKPEADEFVKLGGKVSTDTTVCLVEAMKVYNEIPAETSGTIVAILAKNEEAVDFGRPLFKVDTRG